MTSLKYRPDIDGLRAIAVFGVIIYHAFPHALPGGFVGVDIFFVISGYLISGILYKGHRQGRFSFRAFYARRIRRLFPSLITVLVLSLAYGWLILLPDEFQQMGKHIAAGTIFIQNIVFWKESGYFDTTANLKPMLHLWSLAVEEQFYIFFPPLLLLIWKRKWPLAAILGTLLTASMIGSLIMSVQNSASDFFLTPYRAWEFLGGSLLAWWHYHKGHEEDAPLYLEALSWGGVLLMGMGMVWIQKGQPYPGWRALSPVVGTLLLMEGGRGAWVNRRVLSNPALVWVGLISYPLYLFHWPVLSFLHILKGEYPAYGEVLCALALALALSVITYRFIEKPLRFLRSSWMVPALVAAFLTTGIVALLVFFNIIPIRSASNVSKIDVALRDRNLRDGFELMKGMRWVWIKHSGGNGPQTLFLGDCYIQQYASRITEVLKTNASYDRGAWVVTAGGAPPVDGVTNKQFRACRELMPAFWKILEDNPQIDRVVIGAHWIGYAGKDGGKGYLFRNQPMTETPVKEAFLGELAGMVGKLGLRNIKVYLVQSVPSGPELDPQGLLKRSLLKIEINSPGILKTGDFIERSGWLRSRIEEIGRIKGAEVIDPVPFLSERGFCINQNEAGPIRFDSVHLRPGYVKKNVTYMDPTVSP